MPYALGNLLKRGHKSLTGLGSMAHSVLQGELDKHLMAITKTLPDGKVVSMFANPQNPGVRVRQVFSLEERVNAVDSFYRNFAGGRYHASFRMEINAAGKQGKLI